MVIAGVICLYVAAVAAVLAVAARLGSIREPLITEVQCQHCRAFVPAERALWHHAAPECRPCFLERRLHEARSSYKPKDAA